MTCLYQLDPISRTFVADSGVACYRSNDTFREVTHFALPSKKPNRSRLTLRLSMMASTTRSADSTAFPLDRSAPSSHIDQLLTCVDWLAHESVVVSMFAMMPLVKPSMSSGDAFLAILERDFVMMFKPFLIVSIVLIEELPPRMGRVTHETH